MQGVQHEPNIEHRSSLQSMSVNVRLCGSIPRKDMTDSTGGNAAPCTLKACLTSASTSLWNHKSQDNALLPLRKAAVCDALKGLVHLNQGILSTSENKQPQLQPAFAQPLLEPPAWAVPAKGETRLEPVCEAASRHTSVDLTTRACFRVGRSPNSDLQLYHATSSRRHAMVFHHGNGSCYVVDCGSAHGTYVNGIRVPSQSNGGLVIPHKVKRGAMIRFGGPGAPCFLLKSFNFHLYDVQEKTISVTSSPTSEEMNEIVRRNTRLNAMGTSYQTGATMKNSVCTTIEQALFVARKRSFDSLSDETLQAPVSIDEDECIEPSSKRIRCSSPPLVEPSPLRLVSPELPLANRPRVSFSSDPPQLFYPTMITPDESSDEGDHDDD